MSVVYPQIRTSADLLKSTIRIEDLVPFLQQQKAEAGAIVNSKLYGLLPFISAMKEAKIHPVIGLQVQVEFEEEGILPLILYAATNEGYRNLLKISSATAIRASENLPIRWLQSYAKGCIAVIPALSSRALWLEQRCFPFALQLKEAFGENLYVGIARNGKQAEQESFAVALSEQLAVKIIVLHENLYSKQEDFFAYEVATAIESGVKLNESFQLEKSNQQYMYSAEQWQTIFADVPEWLDETRQLLLSCQVDIDGSQIYMPKFPVPEDTTAENYLRERVMEGLKFRMGDQIPTAYLERVNYELHVMNSMGYADYFLIVEDFMRYAREQHILTGPGRGSAASSLVAYALQITQVDPLKYDLLFERFLNPERVSLPDIDIDFVDTRREEVIQYVAAKYGKQYVAQIITFGTLSAKAVARDVARMFNFDSKTLEMISKLIPNRNGITLQDAYTQSEQLRAWVQGESIRVKWFEAALKLEGLPRNASTHAAGVVLSPVPLVDVVPIEMGHDGVYLTQWPMQEVEQSGLLKMDFLGLRNLTILEQIRKSVQFTHNFALDFNKIPLDDASTFQLLKSGDTTGIFQLESDGMRKALREIQPSHFLDIVAVNALYRPGPMDFIPVYARRKHQMEQVIMPHPQLAPILTETYGIIIYQEQIMRIANVMAGFTIGEADLLRRAVSKKKREVLEENEAKFVAGAMKQSYPEHTAKEVYELIVRFADYGFAKSHAVAYSLISYQMAFLKANYPVNFYAALMTNASGNQDKLGQLIQEAKSRGIQILPPSIARSGRHFKVEQGKIRFSLSAIKGVPQPVLKRIAELEPNSIHSIFDLALVIGGKLFTRKNIEPLIKAGALDEFGKDRAVLLATLDAAVNQADLAEQFSSDTDIFGDNPYAFGKPKHITVNPIPMKEKLHFEKEVLGLYLSDHPLTILRQGLQFPVASISQSTQMDNNASVKLLGQVEEQRVIRTKKGEQMAFVTLSDEYGQISLTLFPKEYAQFRALLENDTVLLVEGNIEQKFGKSQVKVRTITNL